MKNYKRSKKEPHSGRMGGIFSRTKRTEQDQEEGTFLCQFLRRIKKFFAHIFFSSLLRRIVILNLAALAGLVGSIMYLNQFRNGLVEAKIASLYTQGQIIAGAIAASASVNDDSVRIKPKNLMDLRIGEAAHKGKPRYAKSWSFAINPERVSALLRHVISPSKTQARIYDNDGKLLVDSRLLYIRGQVLSYNLTPKNTENNTLFENWYRWFRLRACRANIYDTNALEANSTGVYKNLINEMKKTGKVQSRRYCSPSGSLDVSVAVPIQHYHNIVGVLILSTVGSDIEKIVYAERVAIVKVALIVALVLFILSAFLGYTIANPLRRLSEAANRVCGRLNKRVQIPDFSNRQDEIGDLSTSIRDMTNAFYSRMEAIESFAADVSHELKNPLTSLRSALETLPLAKSHQAKIRLYEIMQHDIRRLDRLITDISDASRVDAELARESTELVDMQQLLERFVDATRELQSGEKTICIDLKIEPLENEKTYIVSGHDLRLGQVIYNLLANAKSFVPQEGGKINLHMFRLEGNIHITISDNGPGIRAENIESIFQRFYTDRPGAESFGQNSGLGLSISRQIIEIYGGSLTAYNLKDPENSEKILGACFQIVLPSIH